MDNGCAGLGIEEANLVIGSCRELIDNLLIFIHSNQAGLRECGRWRSAGHVGGLASLGERKIREPLLSPRK